MTWLAVPEHELKDLHQVNLANCWWVVTPQGLLFHSRHDDARAVEPICRPTRDHIFEVVTNLVQDPGYLEVGLDVQQIEQVGLSLAVAPSGAWCMALPPDVRGELL